MMGLDFERGPEIQKIQKISGGSEMGTEDWGQSLHKRVEKGNLLDVDSHFQSKSNFCSSILLRESVRLTVTLPCGRF